MTLISWRRIAAPALALAAAGLFAAPAFAGEPSESMCFLIARGVEGKYHIIPSHLSVLASTQSAQPFSVENPPGFTVTSVQCFRSDLVPAQNDYKVALAGYELFIGVTSRSQAITGKLVLADGKFAFKMVTGEVPDEDAAPLAKRLEEFQAAVPHPTP